MSKKISVIIVNYNGSKYLLDCLQAIKDQLSDIEYEIIVVDNNSEDNSVQLINQHFTDVILIESKINLGFGQGNNLGVEHAKGEFILLLNNDTILLDRIDDCINYFEQNINVGIVGINMLNSDRKYLLAAGHFPNFINIIWLKKMFINTSEFQLGQFSKDIYEVDWITGSFMLLRRNTYLEIGGFDKDYFMYVEDIDLCKKIAKLNLKRIFISNKRYIHFVGFNSKKNPLILNGLNIYINKHSQSAITKFSLKCSLLLSKLIKQLKK